MQYLDISGWAIFKIFLGGFCTFVIFPALLVLRGLILHKVIEKWIITETLKAKIAKCGYEFWLLNNEYKLQHKAEHNNTNTSVYFIGEEPVDEQKYLKYRSAQQEHQHKYNVLHHEIMAKEQLVDWLLHHYKQVASSNQIPSLLDDSYKRHDKNV